MEGGGNNNTMRMGLLNDEPLFEDEPDYHSMESGNARNTSFLPGRSGPNRQATRNRARTTTGRDYVEARATMNGTGQGCVILFCKWLIVPLSIEFLSNSIMTHFE